MSHEDNSMAFLQIEDHMGKETLMNIDILTKTETWCYFSLISFLFVFAFIAGLFSPPKDNTYESSSDFVGNSTRSIYRISNISRWNQFISTYLSFDAFEDVKDKYITTEFRVIIAFYQNGIEMIDDRFSKEYKRTLVLNQKKASTEPIQIFFANFPVYDSIKIAIYLENNKEMFYGTYFQWKVGNPRNPIFQIILRSLFAGICIFISIIYLNLLRKASYSTWHLEQKLTTFLLILCFAADDPLFILQFIDPTQIGIIISMFTSSLFFAFLRYFILVLFGSIVYRNRGLGKCFYLKRILLMILDFSLDLFNLMINSNEISLKFLNFAITSNFKQLFFIFRAIVFGLICIWIGISIFKASVSCDSTEEYKFNSYIAVSVVYLLVHLIALFGHNLPYIRYSSVLFVLEFTCQNFFVYIMAIFHWPYEYSSSS